MKKTIFLIFLSFLFGQCQKIDNGCQTYTLYQISPDFFSYFCSYNQGSWWVYQDSSGFRDSSYVSTYNNEAPGKHTACDGGAAAWVFNTMVIIKSIHDNELYYTVRTDNDNIEEMDVVGDNPIQSFICDSGVYKGDGNNVPISMLDSFNVNNHWYKNVLAIGFNYATTHYFAPNIGIIQKGTEKLIKYNIVK